MKKIQLKFLFSAFVLGIVVAVLFIKTFSDLHPIQCTLDVVLLDTMPVRILDRHGEVLNINYQNDWNIHDIVSLHDIPDFFKQAFIISEDKRFYKHNGVDWFARFHALLQNIGSFEAVRGASTITEQVIRMINPRPRTIWSRWLEGWEASNLERTIGKDEIFEFYLNQVPYISARRGVFQAAHYYFNRDLDTLSKKEMLALVVLVRAPSRMDLYRDTKRVDSLTAILSKALLKRGLLTREEENSILSGKFHLEKASDPIKTQQFVNYVMPQIPDNQHKVRTTLDCSLQRSIQNMLDLSLKSLAKKRVYNGGVLVVDHLVGEILAWVVGGEYNKDIPGSYIDSVTTARQPGSSLKPFLYALALEKGWTTATIIDDSPLVEPVGSGLHSYRNYSRTFYGPVSLRLALGNSLNIPAIRTVQFVGVEDYLKFLKQLGFSSLVQSPGFYGEGIALGNGEVELLELVRAYTVIANRGVFRPLKILQEEMSSESPKRIISEEAASLIASILSDPEARSFEFGSGSLLNLPVQTAVKTGTSSDHRDAWIVGFNFRYVVGIWMGNLDRTPTEGLTGSTGPAILLRGIFSELNKYQDTKPLYLSPKLVRMEICEETGKVKNSDDRCSSKTEWFVRGTEPIGDSKEILHALIRLRQPTNGLEIALDPRIPEEKQRFQFVINGVEEGDVVDWEVNDLKVARVNGGKYLWPVNRGNYKVGATVWRGHEKIAEIEETEFVVK